MLRQSIVKRSGIIAGLLSLAVLAVSLGYRHVLGNTDARAAQDQSDKSSGKFDLANARYFGVQSCMGCHSGQASFPKDFVRLNEYNTWHDDDKHSMAYEVLTSERSLQMGKLLGIEPTRSPACLNCHTVNIPEALQGDGFSIRDGVSCDGCHGQSEHWFGPHIQQVWRLNTGKAKEAWGMADLRDPVRRARLCSSCHIGSVKEGRIITHEMYAAGHPPLPGFELASFSQMLPQHWRLVRDIPFVKNPQVRNPPEKLKEPDALRKFVEALYDRDAADFEETKLVVLGGVVAFQESLRLLAAHAQRAPLDTKPDGPRLEWPELSRYDCYACHHDLKSPSWRQKAGYPGAPGRPYMHAWPTVLVRLAIRQASAGDDEKYQTDVADFQARLKKLYDAFAAQPFGVAERIAPAAEELVSWSETLLPAVRESRFDRKAAQRLATNLVAVASDKYVDYDSARQIAWAYSRIHAELHATQPMSPEVNQAFKALNDELYLQMTPGKKAIVDQLPGALEKLNRYNPEQVMSSFRKIAGTFEKSKD